MYYKNLNLPCPLSIPNRCYLESFYYVIDLRDQRMRKAQFSRAYPLHGIANSGRCFGCSPFSLLVPLPQEYKQSIFMENWSKARQSNLTSGPWLQVKWSHSVVSDSLWPHRLWPTRLLHPWDFPGKNIGVGCHFHDYRGQINLALCAQC